LEYRKTAGTDDLMADETDPPTPENPSSDLPPTDDERLGIRDLNIDDDLRDSYLSYAMSVIVSRALPDARDGLKPSQRRVLISMHDLNLYPRAKEVKCARICGDTSGKYHPHGESIVYPTLVRLAQPFNTRYPLVSSQGNFGSIDGLPAAAMRYTEAKMSAVAEAMLEDLEKDTVDSVPTYDETSTEPIVLPAKFPNLLANGSQGIAVGMATSIPPHNIAELSKGVELLLDNPNASLADLIACIPGPDFPTGGVICGRRGIIEGYRTGRSTITLRAKCQIEEEKNRQRIVVTEIPYMQQKIRLVQKIAEAVKEDRVTGISNVQDHSDRHGIRIVIDVKRDADANIVLNQLYKFTPLQDTVSVIMLALVNNRPQTLSLKAMLTEFIHHRMTVIRRRTRFLLTKARNRAHVVEGLLIAVSSIDEVIARIRSSADIPTARQKLMDLEVSAALLQRALGDEGFTAFQKIMGVQASYNLTRTQTDQILQMQLQRLTALEQDKLLKEYQELRDEITEYERILSSDENIRDIIRADMKQIAEKFGDQRRTQIEEYDGDLDMESLVPDELAVVTISHEGYIKRLPLDTYRTQGRGGKGVTGGQTRDGDFLSDVFVASTHAYILFFTNMGQCYWLKVYDIPAMSRTSQGRAIVNLLELRPDERVASYVVTREFDDRSIFMVTRRGLTKKTALAAYSRPKKGGIIGISLNDGDALIGSMLVKEGDDVVLATKEGMSIRFSESQSRQMGRDTQGVKGIDLGEGDEVVGGVVVDREASLLTVTENGFGKRTIFGEYRAQNRGGKGLIDIKTTDRNGGVVAVASVRDDDEIMLISQEGMVVRIRSSQVSSIGRNTQGVRVMSLSDGDRVVAIAKIAKEDIDEFATPADVPSEPANESPPTGEPPLATPPEADETATP
jgi:DNA gyrase subunit A